MARCKFGWRQAAHLGRDDGSGGDGFVCGDFVDEVAEVAFGVAAVGVAAIFEFIGDLIHEFVYGAALRGLFVEFQLSGEAAQEFCRVDHDEEILRVADEETNRTGVLGEWIRNMCEIFAWRVYQKRKVIGEKSDRDWTRRSGDTSEKRVRRARSA
jgi:hypothetical protein